MKKYIKPYIDFEEIKKHDVISTINSPEDNSDNIFVDEGDLL